MTSTRRFDTSRTALLLPVSILLWQAASMIAIRITHSLHLHSHWVWFAFTAVLFAITGSLLATSGLAARRSSARIDEPQDHTGPPGRDQFVFLGVVAVVCAFVMRQSFSNSWRIPTSFSVDVAPHAAITAWIREHADFPRTFNQQLLPFSLYPNASHAAAAQLSWITGAPPLVTIWWCALAWLASIWISIGQMVKILDRSWRASLVPIVVALMTWRYTVGMVNWDFFYAQLCSLALAVAATAVTVDALDRRTRLYHWVPATLLLSVASIIAFPQQSVVSVTMLAAAALARWRANRTFERRIGTRGRATVAAVIGILVAGLVLVGRQIRFDTKVARGAAEGEVAELSWRSLGGPLPVVLAVVGVVVLVRRTWLSRAAHDRRLAEVALLGALVGPLVLALGLWALQHGIPFRFEVTRYRVLKNVYPIVPFALVATGVGFGAAVRSVEHFVSARGVGAHRLASAQEPSIEPNSERAWPVRSESALMVASGAVAVALLFGPTIRALTWHPIIGESSYRLALDTAQQYDPEQVGLVGPRLQPYVLWWAGLRRNVYFETYPEVPTMSRWLAWPDSPERYLLVSGAAVESYVRRPGVRVIRRVRDAALLERVAP